MDLNLYLGTGSLSLDLDMDLIDDLSLRLTSRAAPPGQGNDPQPPQSPPLASIGFANEDIFHDISPHLPVRTEPYTAYNTLASYHSPPHSPGIRYSPSFGDDVIVRNEIRSLFNDAVPAGQSGLGDGAVNEGLLSSMDAREEAADTLQQLARDPVSRVFDRSGGSSPFGRLLRSPERRIRNLIEVESDRRARRSRALQLLHRSRAAIGSSVVVPGRRTCDAVLDRRMEAAGEEKVNDNEIGNERAGNGMEDTSRMNNFDCNICLDMAKEPVVTSCGHLYCWPCLYQWLHLHSVHKECPVCKGEVEMNITPIYGRGSSGKDVEERSTAGGDLGLKIPPRPGGRRFESLRQQMQRPLSRRSMESVPDSWRRRLAEGTTDRWRRIAGELRNLARMGDGTWRLSRHLLGNTSETSDAVHHRSRSRRLFRMSDNLNLSSNPALMELATTLITDTQVHTAASVNQGAANLFHDGIINATPEGRSLLQNEAAGNSFFVSRRDSAFVQPEGPETPVASNPHNTSREIVSQPPVTPQSADQASASSTLALIQDDAGVADASVERNSAGSSGLVRRRGWTEASGSLEFDGGGFTQARKRRRLN